MRGVQFQAWQKHHKYLFAVAAIQFASDTQPGFVVKQGMSGFDIETWTLDEVELLTYTGLVDKNGRKIYDGYLLEAKDYWGEKDYAEVAWNGEQLQWYLKRSGTFYEPLRSPFADGAIVFEVVGNIYENEDMLS